ncbi:MAG: hypothetical protein NC433_03930 [Clostridiales bacterium]|nr:hypothetical protein [Clostridiales bacterium]
MKHVKRISLFFIMASVMFGAGSYATYKVEHFFYPKRYENEQQNENTMPTMPENNLEGAGIAAAESDTKEQEERVIEAAVENIPVITSDTVYLVEEVNMADGTIIEKEEEMPMKYIGLDRDMLIDELKLYEQNPPLTDLKQGFESVELSAFSKDRVVVCKYYRREKENKGYYLMVADHYVVVYEEDKETVHMNTEILLESLSDELQKEIMAGKYMEDEQALYNFLESYSS